MTFCNILKMFVLLHTARHWIINIPAVVMWLLIEVCQWLTVELTGFQKKLLEISVSSGEMLLYFCTYINQLINIQVVQYFCFVRCLGKSGSIFCAYLFEFTVSVSMHWQVDKPHTYKLSCILIKQLKAIFLHCTCSSYSKWCNYTHILCLLKINWPNCCGIIK